MITNQRLKKKEHLKQRRDFARIFSRRISESNASMVIYVARNDLAWSRLGISVSKRLGGAVQRNRIRRRVREAYRISKADLPKGLDIVCVARSSVADKGTTEIVQMLRSLVEGAKEKLDQVRAG